MRNSGQSKLDLLADDTYVKIMIVFAINPDFFWCQYDVFMQPAEQSLEQLPYYTNVSFGYSPLSNCEVLTCPKDKVMQSNWVVMQSDKVVESGRVFIKSDGVMQKN